jgi:NAD(P)-dependent dehydrogenase (short-subunit alcohol dehydrogenase family)
MSGVLTDRVALVTGGGRGIGRALALALAEAGADVAVADVDLPAADAVTAEVIARGRRGLAVEADVASKPAVEAMVQTTVETLGGLDMLINNAGVFPIAPVAHITEEAWDQVMAINLKGVFLCSQAALAPMRRAGGGRIVNVASVSGLVGAVGLAHYAASKAGVIGFTKSLAREVAPMGITVNAIAPGIIDTERSRQTFPEGALRTYQAQVPLRRLGRPEDLTALVVFLASPAAAYITGQVYAIDGGYTMQ